MTGWGCEACNAILQLGIQCYSRLTLLLSHTELTSDMSIMRAGGCAAELADAHIDPLLFPKCCNIFRHVSLYSSTQ